MGSAGFLTACDELARGESRNQQNQLDEDLEEFALSCVQPLRPLDVGGHTDFVTRGLGKLPSEMFCLNASRPWILYWCLHSLELLKSRALGEYREGVIATLKKCQSPSGGFGGNEGHAAHLATTYASLASLSIMGLLDDRDLVNRSAISRFILSMKHSAPDFVHGGAAYPASQYRVCEEGESDLRGVYCALASAVMAGALCPEMMDGVEVHIASCQSKLDGGLASGPGEESHAGYTYCGLAALRILQQASYQQGTSCRLEGFVDLQGVRRWLSRLQGLEEGGFRGRTHKLVDSCYTFWVAASVRLVNDLIRNSSTLSSGSTAVPPLPLVYDPVKVKRYVLNACQTPADTRDPVSLPAMTDTGQLCQSFAGFRDKPGKSPDFYHTCYALSGLSVVDQELAVRSSHADLAQEVAQTCPMLNICNRTLASFFT